MNKYIYLSMVSLSLGAASISYEITLDVNEKGKVRLSSPPNDLNVDVVSEYVELFALEKYFRDKPEMIPFLKPGIQKRITQMKRLSSNQNKFHKCSLVASSSAQGTPSHSSDDPEVDIFIEEILSHVLSEVLEAQTTRAVQAEEQAHDRVPKRTVAIISGITAVACALISAGVTIAIPLTQC